MAKQTINIGTIANDGTGDTIRDAFDKTNDNFNEVYVTTAALTAGLATKEPITHHIGEGAITFEASATNSTPLTTDEIVLDATGARAGCVVIIWHQATTEPSINYGDFTLLGSVEDTYWEQDPAQLNKYTFVSYILDGTKYVTVRIENDQAEAAAGDMFKTTYDPANKAEQVLTIGDADDFATADSTTTFTNKTFDANGTGNNISNLDVDNLAAGVLDTDLGSVAPTDTTIPSAKATKAALDLKATKTQTGAFAIQIETVANKDYTFILKSPIAGTITEVVTKSLSGTATATVKVNTTALGGTANAISSAEQSQAHSTTNTFAVGDDVIVTMSANSACLMAAITVVFTYTLA